MKAICQMHITDRRAGQAREPGWNRRDAGTTFVPFVPVRPCQSVFVHPVNPVHMITLTRNGKIARLPKPIREELNRRLDQGVPGGPLLQWLNSLPEVQAILTADFGGRPINKQSLSQWRHGGYAEWLRQQETRVLAGQILAEARELQPAGRPPLTDQMATWVLIRYLMVVRKLIGQAGAEKADFNLLHEFSHDLMAFQRGDHAKARLQFEWTRFKLLSGLQLPAAPHPEPPKTEPEVTPDQLAVVAQVSKPACRGHAKPLPSNPATRLYSLGFYSPAPPESAPVRPGQTFGFLKFSREPREGWGKKPALLASDFGFRISFGFRNSEFGFPSASDPVRPLNFLKIARQSQPRTRWKFVSLCPLRLRANPARAIIKTRKPLLPLLGVRAGFFPTSLRFKGSRDLQNWMHIGTMNHSKRGPEPRRGGLFVAPCATSAMVSSASAAANKPKPASNSPATNWTGNSTWPSKRKDER